MTEQRCHGCGHPVKAHTERDGCTVDDRRMGICLCWYSRAFAARATDAAEQR